LRELGVGQAHTLTVDAGDLLGWRPDVRRHETLLDGIRQIGYDVIGLGDNDFVDGAPFLSDAIRMRKLPVVAANIAMTANSGEIAPPYRIVKKGGLRIGVIGLVSVESFRTMPPSRMKEIAPTDPAETLRRLLPDVRKKSDIVILLSHGGVMRDRELARQFPGIAVIVGSHDRHILHTPIREGETLIVQAGPNGAYTGELILEIDRNKRIRDYRGRLIPIDEHITPDLALQRRIDAYYETPTGLVRQGALHTPDRTPFQGAKSCQPCHQDAYLQWKASRHAHAFETLVLENKNTHPECLGCHTTGFGQPSGYRDTASTPHLSDVQCEACHRMTAGHDFPLPRNPVPPVTPEVCTGCHTPSQSPGFRYEEALSHVKH